MKKRLLSLLLALVMIVGMIPATTLIASAETTDLYTLSGSISGVASDTQTTVTLHIMTTLNNYTPLKSVTVTGNGSYSFEDLEFHNYKLTASANGYKPSYWLFRLESDRTLNFSMTAYAFTVQPFYAGKGSDELHSLAKWELNFEPVKLQAVFKVGRETRYVDIPKEATECSLLSELDCRLIAWYGEGDNDFVRSATIAMPAFTTQPAGGNAGTNQKLTVNWGFNFPPVKTVLVTFEPYYGGSLTELEKNAVSAELGPSPKGGYYQIRGYYNDEEFVYSDRFNVNGFVTQPVGGGVILGENLTVNWETNFTPVKQAIFYTRENSSMEIKLRDLDATATSVELSVNRNIAKYLIVSYISETEYVVSEPFSLGYKAPYTADSRFVVGGTMTVDIERMAEADESWMEAYLEDSVTYSWFRDGERISDATGQSYTPTESDLNCEIYAGVQGGTTSLTTFTKTIEEEQVGKVEAQGTGYVYDSENGTYVPTFSTLAAYSTDGNKIDIPDFVTAHPFYTKASFIADNKLTTEPALGETYYFSLIVDQYVDGVSYDYDHLSIIDSSEISLPGFEIEFYSFMEREMGSYLEIKYSAKKVADYDGWVQNDGKWFYYENGAMKTGWLLLGDTWYYMDASGVMLTGWQQLGYTWYYFNAGGDMATGWLQLGNTWYYLSESGAMVTGWLQLGSTWYYFNAGGDMATGIITIDGAQHSFSEGGAWLGEVTANKTGWVQENGYWYYYDASGNKVTGWLQLGSTWYYMDASGVMLTGWQQLGYTWYYFNAGGDMATGWLQLGNTWYYLSESGAMVTGWLQLGSTWYYFNEGGAMLTGWQQLGYTWYYFNEGGAMVTGTVVIDGVTYEFTSSGAWIG